MPRRSNGVHAQVIRPGKNYSLGEAFYRESVCTIIIPRRVYESILIVKIPRKAKCSLSQLYNLLQSRTNKWHWFLPSMKKAKLTIGQFVHAFRPLVALLCARSSFSGPGTSRTEARGLQHSRLNESRSFNYLVRRARKDRSSICPFSPRSPHSDDSPRVALELIEMLVAVQLQGKSWRSGLMVRDF